MKTLEELLNTKISPEQSANLTKKHKDFSWLIMDMMKAYNQEEITQSRFRELIRLAVEEYIEEQSPFGKLDENKIVTIPLINNQALIDQHIVQVAPAVHQSILSFFKTEKDGSKTLLESIPLEDILNDSINDDMR